MTKVIKAVIFDLDGVLIDSVDLHCKAFMQAFREFGIKGDRKRVKEMLGESALQIIKKSALRDLTNEEAIAIRDRKTEIYQSLLGENPGKVVAPGARELLEKLKKMGLKIGLATGTRKTNVDNVLPFIGRFDAIVAVEDVKRSKPDPEIYTKAIEKLGVKPTEAVVVEDAVYGVLAGKRAGAKVIAIEKTFPRERLAEAGADFIVKELVDVLEIVKGMG